MPDRFDSREEIPWASQQELEGHEARCCNVPLTENPYEKSSQYRLWQSWNAGWADADMGLISDETATKEGG